MARPKHLKIEERDSDTECELCDLPTPGLPLALVQAMQRSGGVDACRECVERATDEANRERGEADNGE